MKIIKKIIPFTFVIFMLLVMASCSDNVEPSVEVEVISIEVSGFENETVYQGFSYTKSNSVIVTAKYNDGSEKNVTENAKFSKLSTSTVGPAVQQISYSYNGKTVYTDYEVLVLDYSSQRISLDTTNVKTVYGINEKLSLKNLKLTAYYPTGAQVNVSQYDVEMTDIYNIVYDTNKVFVHDGIYDVKITYQNCSSSFSIMVYNDEMTSFHYKISNSLDYEKNENVNFEQGKDLFKSLYANVYVKGMNCMYDYSSLEYDGTKYEASLKIKSSTTSDRSEGLILAVTKPVKVVMLTKLDANTLSIRDSNEMVVRKYGISMGVGYVGFELEAGSYTISSMDNYINIYDLYFVYDSELNMKKYDSIEIDESTLKNEYHYNDSFNPDSFIVNGIINEDKETISTNDYKIELYYEGRAVSDFSYEGKYQIKVSYIGLDLCDTPVKLYDVVFNFTNMDKLYLNKIVVNGVEISIAKNQFYYNVNISNDITEITLELEIVGEATIYVNGVVYTKGMTISINPDESIKINVTDGSMTTGYELILIKTEI